MKRRFMVTKTHKNILRLDRVFFKFLYNVSLHKWLISSKLRAHEIFFAFLVFKMDFPSIINYFLYFLNGLFMNS
jgi:hypothetical protein